MIDVNRFKNFNDSCGHETGDEALRVLARVLTEQVRSPDCVGRIGGDELALASSCRNTDEIVAAGLRERLHEAVAEAVVPTQSGDLAMEISIGVATAPRQGANPHDLLRAADRDMYAEKNHRPGSAACDRSATTIDFRI